MDLILDIRRSPDRLMNIEQQTHLISFRGPPLLFLPKDMLRGRFVTCVRHFTPLHNPNPISLSETIKWLVVRLVVAARRNLVEVKWRKC